MIVALVLAIAPGLTQADVERVIDYEYDGAGNIIRIITQEQSNPPTISPLDPDFINIGRTISVTATGTNLLGVDVTSDETELSIGSINSSSTQVTFELTASNLAPIGPVVIRFTSALGEAQETIFVAEPGPELSTDPHPIAIDDGGAVSVISLIFSEPRLENETYSISVDDVGVASVVSNSFTILAGQSQANISLTGISEGATNLQITLPVKFYSYLFPVYVSETYDELLADFPDMQHRNLFTDAVGVVIQEDNPFLPNTVTAGPVGVLIDSNAAYYSSPVGVFYGDGLVGQLLSMPVGVLVSDAVSYAYSTPVGTIYGPILDASTPAQVAASTTTDFDLSGFNLGEALNVTVVPADEVTVGVFTVNPEGTLLTVSITIDSIAAPGQRELVVDDINGPIQTRSGLPLTFDIQ